MPCHAFPLGIMAEGRFFERHTAEMGKVMKAGTNPVFLVVICMRGYT